MIVTQSCLYHRLTMEAQYTLPKISAQQLSEAIDERLVCVLNQDLRCTPSESFTSHIALTLQVRQPRTKV